MSPVGGGGLRQCGGCGLLTGNLQTALLACTRHHCTPALHPPPLHSSCPLVLHPAPLHHTHPQTRDQTHMFYGHTALSNHPGHLPPRGPWCIFWSSVYKSTIDNFASIKLSSGLFSFHSSWVALFWIPCVAPALVVSDMSGWGAAVQGRAEHRRRDTAHCQHRVHTAAQCPLYFLDKSGDGAKMPQIIQFLSTTHKDTPATMEASCQVPIIPRYWRTKTLLKYLSIDAIIWP